MVKAFETSCRQIKSNASGDVLWELLKHVDVHYETGLRSGVTGNDIAAMLDRLDVAVSPAPAPVTPTQEQARLDADFASHSDRAVDEMATEALAALLETRGVPQDEHEKNDDQARGRTLR